MYEVSTIKLIKMKIELKKVSFNERMSEETNCFVADVYVDGVKCAYAKNDGRGGCTDISSYPNSHELFKKVMIHCENLPDYEWKWDNEVHYSKNNIEEVVDHLFEEWLKERDAKKMDKFDLTHIRWGVPNALSYRSVKFNKPINLIPHLTMQGYLNKWKESFEKDVVFLNRNLQEYKL